MRVVIYEPIFTGHHFAYVGRLVRALTDLPCDLILATSPEAIKSEQYRVHLTPSEDAFHAETVAKTPPAGRQGRIELVNGLIHCLDQIEFDHLYVPYGDLLTLGLGVRPWLGRKLSKKSGRSPELEMLAMRGKFIYPSSTWRDWAQGELGRHFIRQGPWNVVHHLDPRAIERLGGDPLNPTGRFRLIPDPVERSPSVSRVEARRSLGLPEEGRYIGLVGGIDRRKGAHLLLRAFRQLAPNTEKEVRLFLAGKVVGDDIRQLLQEDCAELVEQGRILTLDRYLSSEEMLRAAVAVDLLATPYPNHIHSASVVIVAASVRRPVVASRLGWMERTIDQFGLGATFPAGDIDALSEALLQGLETADQFQLTPTAERFVAYHSVENFTAHWSVRLRERLGLSPSPELKNWRWVLEGPS